MTDPVRFTPWLIDEEIAFYNASLGQQHVGTIEYDCALHDWDLRLDGKFKPFIKRSKILLRFREYLRKEGRHETIV